MDVQRRAVDATPVLDSLSVGAPRYAPAMSSLAAYPAMRRRDRERLGLRECRAAWLLGLTVREYRTLEAGDDALLVFRVWERMVALYGWPT